MLALLQTILRATPSGGQPKFPGDPRAALAIDILPPAFRDHVPDRYLRALGAL
jgi:hypothetical protein